MSLTDIKNKSQGFTIVELLIVVVVIAILAAITIVSYNGITSRANASAAKSTAASVQKKAELYQAENSLYPTVAQMTGAATDASWYIAPASFTPNATTPANLDGSTAPTSGNGKTQVQYSTCGSPVTGAKITYWGYGATDGTNSTTTSGAKVILLGTGCSA